MDWTNGTEFLDLGLSSGFDEDKARLLHNWTELNPESSFVLAPASNAFFRTPPGPHFPRQQYDMHSKGGGGGEEFILVGLYKQS